MLHSVKAIVVATVLSSTSQGILAAESGSPGTVRLVLPPAIYATTNVECNIYFDNIVLVLDSGRYAFDAISPVGVQFEERWAFTPSSEDIGEHPITIDVRDESNQLIARGKSTVVVRPADAAAPPATLLIAGASFTEYSVYPAHILDLSRQTDAQRLNFIGSRGPGNMPPTGDLRHEGYAGWSAEAFAVNAGPLSRSGFHKRGATGSPFVYVSESGEKTIDFARYCSEFNQGGGPDLVTIQVGANDTFSANDQTIDQTIDRMFSHYDNLVAAIHEVRADTRIGIQMITPPTQSQDGFRNYRGPGRQTRWQFRRNQHRLMERMLNHFAGRTGEHVYLVPSYLNLDTVHNFPTSSMAMNARSKINVERVTNGTHPTADGYRQIGDSIYAWIVNVMAPTALIRVDQE